MSPLEARIGSHQRKQRRSITSLLFRIKIFTSNLGARVQAILAPIDQQRLGAGSRKSSETKMMPRASHTAPALLDYRGQALSVAITGRLLSNTLTGGSHE
jgi:hypothetical protein